MKFKKFITISLLFVLALFIVACGDTPSDNPGDDPIDNPGDKTEYSLTLPKDFSSNFEVTEGENFTIPVSATQGANVEYKSSDDTVINFENGTFNALKAGKVTIIITLKEDNTKKLELEVEVKAKGEQKITYELTLSGETTVELDKEIALTAVLAPELAGAEFTWALEDSKIANITSTGANAVVKGLKIGSTKLTCTLVRGEGEEEVKAEATITVTNTAATEVKVSGEASLASGSNTQLTASVTPAKAQGTYEWKSSNEGVATVDETGKVTAVSQGTATITCTFKQADINAELAGTFDVTVTAPNATSVAISGGKEKANVGEELQFSCTLAPAGCNPDVTWSVNSEKLASIDSTGKLTIKAAGRIVVTATAVGGAKAEYVLEASVVPTSIVVYGYQELNVNQTEYFKAVVVSTQASQDVVWSTSDANVLTVSEDGLVCAVGAGSAKITATAKGTSVKQEFDVTVVSAVEYSNTIVIDPSLANETANGAKFTIEEKEYTYGTTLFNSLDSAVITEGTKIILMQGSYGNYELKVSNVYITELVDNKAELVGVFKLADGVKNVTFDGIHGSGAGQIFGVDNNANITVKNCVFDASTVDASQGTIYFDKNVTNLKVLNTKFNANKAARNIRFEGVCHGLEVVNCLFDGGGFDPIRTANGYPEGYVAIKNSTFLNSSQSGLMFSKMGGVYLEVLGNTFKSMNNTAVDVRTTNGVACTSLYNISYNVFDNTGKNSESFWGCIRLRFNDFTDNTLKVNVNYNKFIDWSDASMKNVLDDATTNNDKFELCNFENNYFSYNEVDGETFANCASVYSLISEAKVERAMELFNLDSSADSVKLVGTSSNYPSKTLYPTLASALAEASKGDCIYLLPGTYSDNVRVTVDDITIRSLNYGLSVSEQEEALVANYTGKITLAKNLAGLTIDGVKFSGEAQILNEKGDEGTTETQATDMNINGFNFINNVVESGLGSSTKGFIYFVENKCSYSHDLVFTGNSFVGQKFGAEAMVYIDNVYDVTLSRNTFKAIPTKAFYINDTTKGLSGQYSEFVSNYFEDCGVGMWFNWLGILPMNTNTAEIYIMNNEFHNITNQAIYVARMNNADEYKCIKIEYNRFYNVGVGVELDRASKLANIDLEYNEFWGIPTKFYYVSNQNQTSYFSEIDAKYNLFVDDNGAIITPASDKFDIKEEDKAPLNINDQVEEFEYREEFIELATEIVVLDDDELYAGENKEAEIMFLPSDDVFYKDIIWIVEDPSVLRFEKNIIVPLTSGTTKVTAIYAKDTSIKCDATFTVKEYNVLELRYEGNGILKAGETVNVTATLDNVESGTTVTWSSSDNNIATVDQNGVVTAVGKGVVTITCKINGASKTATVGFTVIDDSLANDLLKLLVESNNGVIMYRQINYIGYESGYESVPHYVYGSANKYFAGTNPTITPHYMPSTAKNVGWVEHPEIKLITVHDTGAASPGSTALANANWCTSAGNDNSSWHYTIGNDGIYQQLDDKYVAWHAGDGSDTPTGLIDTGVKATEPGKRATVTIDDGKYVVNGTKTNLDAPKGPNGETLTTADIVPTGIVTIIGDNGNYFIGTYYNKTYKKIASYGGYSSIGIETAVNKGSDVYLTWQYTAKFVASKLVQYNLTLDRMVYHNNLSGKNCPNTMLTNNLTGMFEDMVAVEYEIAKNYSDYKITFTSSNPDVLDNTGRVVGEGPRETTQVNYTITVEKGDVKVSQECSVLVIGTRNK